MKKLATAGLVLAGAMAAGIALTAAVAQESPRRGGFELMLRSADANGDGSITAAEARTSRERMFARMDANGDGFLTEADRQARAGEKTGRRGMRGARDADADGRISRAEFLAGEAPWFDRFDANGNDVLEPAEIEALRMRAGQLRAERAPANPGQTQ
jgi:hypothetical protein